jgi:hypothetical protein
MELSAKQGFAVTTVQALDSLVWYGKIRRGSNKTSQLGTDLKKGTNASTPRSKFWYDDEEMRWAIRQWATRIGVKEPRVRFQMMEAQWGTITLSGIGFLGGGGRL